MIECANCGTENKFDGAAFCRSCGNELSKSKSTTTAVEEHPAEVPNVCEEDSARNDMVVTEDTASQDSEAREDGDPQHEPESLGSEMAEAKEIESANLSDQTDENATDFDRALETYNKPDQDSLQIESAADVLMRTQGEEDSSIESKLNRQDDTKDSATGDIGKDVASSNSGTEKNADSSNEAVSATDKEQLLANLNKTFQPETPAEEATTDDSQDSTNASSAYDDYDSIGDSAKDGKPAVVPGPSSELKPTTDSPAHDIVYMRGNKLLLAMTPPPRPGESVKFRGKKYTITKGPLDRKTLSIVGGAVLLFLAVIFFQHVTAPSAPQPAMFGMVKNSETNEVLAGVNVSIPQLDIFTVTDEYGSFRFVGLQNETYQVRLEGELYEAKFYPVIVSDNNSAFLQASLDPILARKSRSKSSAAADKPAEVKPKLGQLTVNCNIEDAEVVVNGNDIGEVGRTFSRMKTGNHSLLVKRDGYDDFEQPITIDAGEETVVTVNLLKSEPDKPKVLTAADHFAKAEDLMQYRKYTEAAGHYTLALAKDREYVQAYLRRAEANVALGKGLAARADYRAAADFYLNSANYNNAISCFNKIVNLAPNSVGALQMRGWAKIWNGNDEGGLFDLNKALSIVPDDVDARFQVGKALYVTGSFKEAEKALKKLRNDAEDRPEIYAYLALTQLARGEDKDARKYYEKFEEYASSTLQARMSSESDWQKLLAIQDN